jgi:hypothetical protein
MEAIESSKVVIDFNPTPKQDEAWLILHDNTTNILFYGGSAGAWEKFINEIYFNYNIMNKSFIKNYENYFVTDDGRVFSTNYHLKNITKELKFDYSGKSKKYRRVTLSKDNKTKRFLVHRLVAEYFIDKKEGKNQINHIDGNPDNNNASNLEWVSQSENMKHAFKTGLQKPQRNPTKLNKEDVIKIFKLREQGMFYKDIAKKFNIHKDYVKKIISGKYWRDVE